MRVFAEHQVGRSQEKKPNFLKKEVNRSSFGCSQTVCTHLNVAARLLTPMPRANRQRIASIGGGGDCCSRHLGAHSLSSLGRLRPRDAAGGDAGNRLNWWGNARCAAPPPASVATAQRCSRRAVPARTDTSRRRTCRFRPTFVGVMRWRKKDPPELAMRCRLAV